MDKYGTPSLVIPNPPASGAESGGEAFLLVKAQIEVPRRKFGALRARLTAAGYRIVEHHPWFADRPWNRDRVRLTLEEDVTPISRAEVERAATERRVLSVSTWRSMGDGYVDFRLAAPDSFSHGGYDYDFLFPGPGSPREAELPPSGALNAWDSADEFFHAYRSPFTRDLPADLPPEAPP